MNSNRTDFWHWVLVLTFIVAFGAFILKIRGGVPHVWTESEIRQVVRDELARRLP